MNTGNSCTPWSTPEVGYFIPNNNFKRHDQLKHMETGKDLIPRFYNVQAFVNHLRALVVFKEEHIIRANVHSCLRDDALDWYDTELTDSERIELSVLPLDQGWFKMLLQRFELPYEIGLFRWETAVFGDGTPGCQAARNLLRHAQAVGIHGTKRQLTRIWEGLQGWSATAGKIPKPRSGTSVSDFMREIDMMEQSRMYEDHSGSERAIAYDSNDHGFGDWLSWGRSKLKLFDGGQEVDPELGNFLKNCRKGTNWW